MEVKACVLCQSTPKFAKQISSKYGRMASYDVESDLKENHGRTISRNRIQAIADCVGQLVADSELEWKYDIPVKDEQTAYIVFSMDGTTANMVSEGWREVMSGTISFYNKNGNRLHSLYIGQAPEYGKREFKKRLQREIDQVKTQFPKAIYIGLADGAIDNWRFLETQVDYSILDFWHAAEYLTPVSKIVSKSRYEQKQWLEQKRHQLRHDKDGADLILKEMKGYENKRLSIAKRKKLEKSITYFTNHKHQMDYPTYTDRNMPIGSGVTEAACKVLVKQRFCNSGMRWKAPTMQNVMNIRGNLLSKGRWEQLWTKVDELGMAA